MWSGLVWPGLAWPGPALSSEMSCLGKDRFGIWWVRLLSFEGALKETVDQRGQSPLSEWPAGMFYFASIGLCMYTRVIQACTIQYHLNKRKIKC